MTGGPDGSAPSSRTREIAAAGAAARDVLDGRHHAREVVIAACRRVIQASAASIRATHRGELETAARLAAEARDHLTTAHEAIADDPGVHASGPLQDARKEYAEASLTLAFVRDDPIPSADDLGVDAAVYLNGMAEAASELRRQVLDLLRRGDLATAERLMATMDDVYSVLVTIDYPDAVTNGLRRTTDALRAVLERTRGDLTTTTVAARLQAAIEAARGESEHGGAHET